MGICSNRPEGFGPKSTLSDPLPTTCFTDTILIPLPIYLLPILILASILITKKRQQQRHRRKLPPTSQIRVKQARSWPYTISLIFYYFLIGGNILMEGVEIVRLSLIDFGIGLLPLVIVGLLAGGFLHATHGVGHRVWMWQAINIFLWTGGLVFSVIKTAELLIEGIGKRKGTKYPMVDHVTDTAVMAGLYLLLILFELLLWRIESRRGMSAETESLGSGPLVSSEGGVRSGSGDEAGRYQEDPK